MVCIWCWSGVWSICDGFRGNWDCIGIFDGHISFLNCIYEGNWAGLYHLSDCCKILSLISLSNSFSNLSLSSACSLTYMLTLVIEHQKFPKPSCLIVIPHSVQSSTSVHASPAWSSPTSIHFSPLRSTLQLGASDVTQIQY